MTQINLSPSLSLSLSYHIQKLHACKLPMFVKLFRNEFMSQPWDFCSDAIVEINSFVMGAEIDGVITEFPRIAVKYKKNRCLGLGNNTPYYMSSVQTGGLLQLMAAPNLPFTQTHNPILREFDVVEPPLPAVVVKSPTSDIGNVTISPTTTPSNGLPKVVSFILLSYLASLLTTLALFEKCIALHMLDHMGALHDQIEWGLH